MVFVTRALMLVRTTDSAVLQKPAYSSKGLYKFLLRQCNKIPGEEISLYYKHHIRQSFNQHADETDPERIVQIINQAVKDIDWVLKKLWRMEGPSRLVFEDSEDGFTAYTNVSSTFKFYNSLSTFASRPELVVSHIRSTDIDWTSVDPASRKCYNNLNCENLFEFVYSTIYHQGKFVPSKKAGELCGSLHEETIKAWIMDDNNCSSKIISLRRFIHHRPAKDASFGWTSCVEESWDFNTNTVRIAPVLDYNTKPFLYVPFITLEAQFLANERKAKLFVKRFAGPLVPDAEDGMLYFRAVVLPKIIDWLSDEYIVDPPKLSRLRPRPLTYTDNSAYWLCYDLLKSGPAEGIKSIWEESTDPIKFIHEDIGIASYIVSFIHFIQSERYLPVHNTECIEILDLGCGNGLLCYFISQLLALFSNTSSVTGFDIRSRKIWPKLMEAYAQTDTIRQLFKQKSAKLTSTEEASKIILSLTERTFVPHKMDDLINTYACTPEKRKEKSLWIIGNHSDELTPWIPVVCRRLNATGFFIIPCCAYDFFSKYQRRANIPCSSNYHSYIEYVCSIGDKYGYLPTLEKLRIPSTKNICLIGMDCSRKSDSAKLNSEVKNILDQLNDGDKGNSFSKFVPRSKESALGSPKLDRKTSESLVDKIFKMLIFDCNNAAPTKEWNRGRQDLTFKEIFCILTQSEKDMLKGKGNGLKTLVLSNRNLFVVENNHFVKLRVPKENDFGHISESSRKKIKTRPCYFHRNHPQGCPLSKEVCTFRH